MKRLFVSAAVLPLLAASVSHAETKISTATTTPVRTSTIANGQPDQLTIESAGSIAPTVAGPAVTVDSSNAVTNAALANNSVAQAQIQADAVITGKIANDAVTTSRIASGAV